MHKWDVESVRRSIQSGADASLLHGDAPSRTDHLLERRFMYGRTFGNVTDALAERFPSALVASLATP